MKSIAAVVVTYNRKDLLAGCLRSLLAQTAPLAAIYVIDNACTDGTPELLADQGFLANPSVHHHRLPTNVGGAGGFHNGLARAHADGHDWVWLMDDDTDPTATALAELMAAHDRCPAERKPVLMASKVEWTDGTLHPMNRVAVKQRFAHEDLWLAAQHGCLSLRSATFVSVIVHRSCVDRYGLPIAGYFLWNDDVEYTARILRHKFGLGVPTSLALHRTGRPYGTLQAPPERFFLYVRNQLWMLKGSSAFDRMEKLQICCMLALNTVRWTFSSFSLTKIRFVLKALIIGICSRP